MWIKLLSFTLSIVSWASFGQSKSDSNENPFSNKLIGTTVLKGSSKNREARWIHGVYLEKMEKSECQNGGSEKINPTRINKVQIVNDTILVVQFTINENCCNDFLGEIEVTKDKVLNLTYQTYGADCACNCCFGLTYEIFLFREEEYELEKMKTVMINGIKETETKIEWVKQ